MFISLKVNTIYKYADSIFSPLGVTTAQNWSAVTAGGCGIEQHNGVLGFPDSFWGALIPEFEHTEFQYFTKFEQLLILAAHDALSQTNILPSSPEVLFIVATTKGNIDLIDPEQPHSYTNDRVFLWKSAQLVSAHFKNPNRPIVHLYQSFGKAQVTMLSKLSQ